MARGNMLYCWLIPPKSMLTSFPVLRTPESWSKYTTHHMHRDSRVSIYKTNITSFDSPEKYKFGILYSAPDLQDPRTFSNWTRLKFKNSVYINFFYKKLDCLLAVFKTKLLCMCMLINYYIVFEMPPWCGTKFQLTETV